MNALSLLELNFLVRQVIEGNLDREYWVEAELSECRENRGHCYMELIQKDPRSNTPVARASAKCWRTQWAMLQPHFERTTGQQLHAGMKLLLKVYAQFHETYGFSWIVIDIDPTYTLGDMARRRQEIISKLKQEGVFDLQKELSLPLFCQRIAVISSTTAAGYGDFCHQLADNPYGFRFVPHLFTATMQGEGVEQSIISALNDIYNYSQDSNHSQLPGESKQSPFHCVVIIRGGGATADFSGFDTLALAENVAQFPLPVITGIGHDRDECILDMVSHTRVKTPTAAATFLIDHLKYVLDVLDDAQDRLARYAQQKISTLNAQLSTLNTLITRHAQQKISTLNSQLSMLNTQIPLFADRMLTTRRHELQLLEEKARSLDPSLLLRRGYSITVYHGRALRDPSLLTKGDEIETRIEKGTVKSIIA